MKKRIIRLVAGPLFAALVAIVPMAIIFVIGCVVSETTVGLVGEVTSGSVLTLWVIFLVVLGRLGHFQGLDRLLAPPMERKPPEQGRPLEYGDLAL